ncbi:ABC-three component system middle component 2 [Paenibacillus swuensis]|uniref:ABC-three component system middle component 2 n=1 Tax=Paenibacillus swuensis TaxID=1178515 RepID=UPI0008384792|nr:ABC-three component system middle component 2 [Paenibacillus swuensis]
MGRIYNTPLELGLRALFILRAARDSSYSLDRLVYLDYLTTYSSDSELDLKSLHPDYPLRVIELFTRRTVLQQGLSLMATKGLIGIEYNDKGFLYSGNINTVWFLTTINNNYAIQLSNSVEKIIEYYKEFSDEQIKEYIDKHYKSWGNEFANIFPYNEEAIL